MRWDIDKIIFEIGVLEVRWYGLFFAFGLLLGAVMMAKAFRRRGYPDEHASALTLWLPAGMILGAHLIHLIFYEPRSFIDNPIRIIQLGSGLSSHGGALGVIVALYIWCKKKKVSMTAYLDAVLIGAVWLFPWVRIGNLFNSEIYGRETDVAWAFIFEQSPSAGNVPRHPTQIYEALAGFILIGISLWMEKNRHRFRDGFILSVLLCCYFTGRFFVEFFKEYQTLTPDVPLTMGQWLSLPVVIVTGAMIMKFRGEPPERPEPVIATEKVRPASVRSVRKVKRKPKKRKRR